MFALVAILLAAVAAAVPSNMIGTWSSGRCSDQSSRLVITATTAKLGTSRAQKIVYYPNDDGAGHGAIHWQQEGNVDNFVYVSATKKIVHNVQGYHMPGAVLYARCPST
jgi:hypothetical protein